MESPKVIFLIPDGDGNHSWCDDPAPGIGMDESDAVKYIRADLVGEENAMSITRETYSFNCPCGWLHLQVTPGFKCKCGAVFSV